MLTCSLKLIQACTKMSSFHSVWYCSKSTSVEELSRLLLKSCYGEIKK